MRGAWAGLLGLAAWGCHTPPIPDPNRPDDPGLSLTTRREIVQDASEDVFARVAKGEIPESRAKTLIAELASRYLAPLDPKSVPPDEAWAAGELARTAGKLDLAARFLQTAVAEAKRTGNADRWVNDSLRLAAIRASQGQVSEAIRLARGTFGVPPKEKAPILYGVALEVVPAARGKGFDGPLAVLLADAVDQAMKTEVDANTESGRAFLKARRFHVRRARTTVSELALASCDAEARRAALRLSLSAAE